MHVCQSDEESDAQEEDEALKKPKPKIIQTRRPDYAPAYQSWTLSNFSGVTNYNMLEGDDEEMVGHKLTMLEVEAENQT